MASTQKKWKTNYSKYEIKTEKTIICLYSAMEEDAIKEKKENLILISLAPEMFKILKEIHPAITDGQKHLEISNLISKIEGTIYSLIPMMFPSNKREEFICLIIPHLIQKYPNTSWTTLMCAAVLASRPERIKTLNNSINIPKETLSVCSFPETDEIDATEIRLHLTERHKIVAIDPKTDVGRLLPEANISPLDKNIEPILKIAMKTAIDELIF